MRRPGRGSRARHESGGGVSGGRRRRGGGYHGYGKRGRWDDEGDNDNDGDGAEMLEEHDRSVVVDKWVAAPGTPALPAKLVGAAVDEEEDVLTGTTLFDDDNEPEREYQEHTGNEGATLVRAPVSWLRRQSTSIDRSIISLTSFPPFQEFTYHTTAVVVWPKSRRLAVLGVGASVEALKTADAREAGGGERQPSADATLRELPASAAARPPSVFPGDGPPGAHAAALLRSPRARRLGASGSPAVAAALSRSEALASHDVASTVADAVADGATGGEAAWRAPLEGLVREAAARGDAPAALAARLVLRPPCGGAAMRAALALAFAAPIAARCGGGGGDGGGGCAVVAPWSGPRAAAAATAVAALLAAVDASSGDSVDGGGGGGEETRAAECVDTLRTLSRAAAAVPGASASLLRSGECGAAAVAAAARARTPGGGSFEEACDGRARRRGAARCGCRRGRRRGRRADGARGRGGGGGGGGGGDGGCGGGCS